MTFLKAHQLSQTKVILFYGGIALMTLLCSSVLSHAGKTPQDQDEKMRVDCLWHLGSKIYRAAALEHLEKKAAAGDRKAQGRYLKKLGEFLREDPSYRSKTINRDSNGESEGDFLASVQKHYGQTLENISSSQFSHTSEKDFEIIKLKLFYKRAYEAISGDKQEALEEDIRQSLRTLQLSVHNKSSLLCRIRHFQYSYLSPEVDIEGLEETIEGASSAALAAQTQDEAEPLKRLAARINFQLANYSPPKVDSQKILSRKQVYYRNSAKLGYSLAKYYLADLYNDENSGFYDPQKAFNWYLEAAQDKNSLAAYKIATLLEKGEVKLHIKQDESGALDWHKQASKSHPYSQYELGRRLLLGQGVEKNIETGLQLISLSVEVGYSPAQLFLAENYKTGTIVKQDLSLAFHLYNKAAEQGETRAYYYTGYAYEKAMGMPQDLQKAREFYNLGDKADDPDCQVRLGKLYLKGKEIEKKSEEMAFSYFQRASQHGNANGKYYEGLMYLKGQALPRPDHQRAFSYFIAASEKNHPKALLQLGIMKQFGMGTEQNYEQARAFYEKAGQENNGAALYYLGWLYKRGLGIPQDSAQAITLWKKAAALGSKEAAFKAGKAHLEAWLDESSTEHAEKAYLYLNQAALLSHTDALYLLGYVQEKGIGCVKDSPKAIEYYIQAADGGHASAQFKVGQFYERLLEPEHQMEAFNRYKMAAEQHHWQARIALGHLYREGRGTTRDLNQAFTYLKGLDKETSYSTFAGIKLLTKEGYKEALNWVEEQASQGNAYAQNYLARTLEEGILIPQDIPKAIVLYQQAAMKGKRSSQLRIADLKKVHLLKALEIQ